MTIFPILMAAWQNILIALAVLGGLGALFGAALAVASKVFAVEKDPRLDEIIEVLPGANCGGCGFAGCSTFAAALLDGTAHPGGCPVGGEECGKKCAEILGIEMEKNTRLAAFVACSGGIHALRRYEYVGISDCASAAKLAGGPAECRYGCLGLGSCTQACKFGALSIRDGVAHVDHEKCTGCLKCVDACPRHIIHAAPYYADVNIACSSHERGAALRKICDIGCLGCKICEKTCTHDAIHVVDNLAEIDYMKCVGCGDCAAKCPRHLISDSNLNRAASDI